jgi:D-glycero-alpha-D-manno-heptose-7-phosphate kinase
MLVRARAPLRLGLGGGGTDVPPFCDRYGGNVLNATVSLYAYCNIEPLEAPVVQLIAKDKNDIFECQLTHCIEPDGHLSLHKGVYNRITREFNKGIPLAVRVTTYTDVPPGSGLGSSSTLVVAMVKAFVELLNLPLGEYDIAHLAYEIERIDLGCQGGKQDQYAATFGGFNFIEFYGDDRVIVNPLRVKNWIVSELESSLVLFFTGVSRYSSQIIAQQTARVEAQDKGSLEAMNELKKDAVAMKEFLLKGNLMKFAEYMGKSWDAKKRTAECISNNDLDSIYAKAINSGAHAGKLSGAGGGGFMMFLVDPALRIDVIRALEGERGRVVNCNFVKHGTEGWRIA